MKHDYDEQIEFLINNPSNLFLSWLSGEGLFRVVGYDKTGVFGKSRCGCLVQIRTDFYNRAHSEKSFAYINGEIDHELSRSIANDRRIPDIGVDVTLQHLRVFKEWWERIDAIMEERI